jgi:WD40 repeat protein
MRVIRFSTPAGRVFGRLTALHFGPDGRTLAALWRAGANILHLRWWDLRRDAEAGSEFGAVIREDDFTPPDPALSPDHRFLARTANDRGGAQRLEFLDRSARRPRARRLTAWEYTELGGDPAGLNYQCFLALAFSPDGRHLVAAVGSSDPDDEDAYAPRVGLYRWSADAVLRGRGPKSAGALLPDPDFFVRMPGPDVFEWAKFGRSLAFAPGGGSLAAGLWNARVLCWEFPSGRELPGPRLKKRRNPRTWRLEFSPDGRTLAAADEVVALYDKGTATPRSTLPPGPPVVELEGAPARPTVFDVAFDLSGRLLATACGDPLVRWWNAATAAKRKTFDWGIGGVTAVAFSADGCLCAAGGKDGQVAVWDVGG